MIKRFTLFILLNFAALGISGSFTPAGISSLWYQSLEKAPWTPPGWVFGFAWSTIMICLSIYMALSLKAKNTKLIKLYSLQLLLNILWTPVFFYFHQATLGLVIITLLTFLIAYFIKIDFKKAKVLFLLPYMLWLFIAISLNLYIVLYN
jgi:translocator protein